MLAVALYLRKSLLAYKSFSVALKTKQQLHSWVKLLCSDIYKRIVREDSENHRRPKSVSISHRGRTISGTSGTTSGSSGTSSGSLTRSCRLPSLEHHIPSVDELTLITMKLFETKLPIGVLYPCYGLGVSATDIVSVGTGTGTGTGTGGQSRPNIMTALLKGVGVESRVDTGISTGSSSETGASNTVSMAVHAHAPVSPNTNPNPKLGVSPTIHQSPHQSLTVPCGPDRGSDYVKLLGITPQSPYASNNSNNSININNNSNNNPILTPIPTMAITPMAAAASTNISTNLSHVSDTSTGITGITATGSDIGGIGITPDIDTGMGMSVDDDADYRVALKYQRMYDNEKVVLDKYFNPNTSSSSYNKKRNKNSNSKIDSFFK